MTGSGTQADPYIGEIRRGREIGHSPSHKWIWHACIDCGKKRWVKLTNNKPDSSRCNSCSAKMNGKPRRGENAPNWKGGEHEVNIAYGRRKRLRVLEHYGGSPPKCACCGESLLEFLTIDHINGGGNKERQKRGFNTAYYLERENYPSGYRVLCMNCNFALGHYKYCPHQKEGVSIL